MGLKFIVSEAQARSSQATQVSSQAQQAVSSLQQSIQLFLSAPLSSKAYDSAKNYFMVAYTPIGQSIIMTAEAFTNAHKKFVSEYQATVGGEDIDEDKIQAEIDQYQELLHTIDDLIRDAKRPRPDLERRSMNAYEAMQKRKEKLEKLRTYSAQSTSFFSEYNSSQQELNTAINQVKDCKAWNASTGTFDISKLDMNWAKAISNRWKDRQEKIDAKVKAYNLANQEITTKFDDYGNVLGVYVDGKFDAELTSTLQESIRTKNFDMIKGFGSGFIDQLANNNGKSLLNEWFGERKFGAEFDGKQSYAVGQFVADLSSLVQGGAEFFGGGLWAFGGSAASTFFSGGVGTVAVPAINASGLAVAGHGAGVFTSAWNSLGNGYDLDTGDVTPGGRSLSKHGAERANERGGIVSVHSPAPKGKYIPK
ncbi:T7SS effector LXG polymorphic toxin [Enterococcus crotali]